MDKPSKIKRKQLMIAVGGFSGFILLLIFGMWMSDPNKGKPSPRELQRMAAQESVSDFRTRPGQVVSDEESWIVSSEQELAELRRTNRDMRSELNRLRRDMDNLREKEQQERSSGSAQASPARGESTRSPLDEALPDLSGVGRDSGLPPAPQPTQPRPEQGVVQPPSGSERRRSDIPPPPSSVRESDRAAQGPSIQVVDLSLDEPEEGDDLVRKNVDHYFPTGAFGTAILLSGLDAPTGGQARSDPVPVLLRLMDAGQLPNYWNSDVSNCHVLGAGHGDIASERVHIRLETITCVLANGDIIEERISGYIAGEDGKAGMRGKLVEKTGSLVAKSLLAGIPAGLGRSLSMQNRTVSSSALGSVETIDPDRMVQDGLTQGASNALDRVADYYMARANEIYPIIEVDANRIGEMILTSGTDFGQPIIGNTRRQP